MAANRPDITLKGLECSICTETFTKPKLLDCLHTFCESCLVKCFHVGALTISCDLCRAETRLPEDGVEGLRTNFHIAGLVDEISLLEKATLLSIQPKTTCELCEGGLEATHRCFDCSKCLCSGCIKIHSQIKEVANHVTASLEDIRLGNMQVKRLHGVNEHKCHKHRGDSKLFYCQTCEELICGNCTVLDHCKPLHQVVDYQEAAGQRRRLLNDMFPNLDRHIDDLDTLITSSSQVKQKFNENIARMETDVDEVASRMITKVNAAKKRIVEEVKQLRSVRGEIFDAHEKLASAIRQRLHHSLETAKILSKTPSDWNLLSAFPIVEAELRSLTVIQDVSPIDSGLSYVTLAHNPLQVADFDLGLILHVPPRWEKELEIIPDVDDQNDVHWTDISFIQLDKIAVADKGFCRILIYDTEGHKKNILHLKEYVVRFAAMGCMLIIVDTAKTVKVYDTVTGTTFEFATVLDDNNSAVQLSGLTVKGDTILVGDIGRKTVTEHRPSDGALLRTIAVNIPPYFLVAINNNRIVISGIDKEHAVEVVDGNTGNTLIRIEPTIHKHQVIKCLGVGYDGEYIYIVIKDNSHVLGEGHVHRYDTEGRFQNCVVNDLHDPFGIAVSPDNRRMAVADNRSVKIYCRM